MTLAMDSLIKNSIYLMATNFVTSFIGFFFWIFAARYYTPDDIGITSAIFSSVVLISMISSLGLNRALIYYLPRDNNKGKIIDTCLTTGIISSIFFSSIFILGLRVWSPGLISTFNSLMNVAIFMIVTVIISFSLLIGAVFTAGKRSSFQMIKESIFHFTKIIPLFIFVSYGAMGILISLLAGLVVSVIIGIFLLSRVWNYKPKFRIDPIIKNMASFSVGNYISDILNNIPKLVLPILILNLISIKSAGYFYIAITVASLLYGISQGIANSFLVESSDETKFWLNVDKSIRFNIILLIPGIILFIIFGHFILNIFNPSYGENATMSMIILTITSIPLSLVNIYNTIKNAKNDIKSMVNMNLIVAIITIVLSILLIRFNIEGISISYLIANIVGAIIVINEMKNPKEFTFRLLNDVKKDVRYFISYENLENIMFISKR